MYQGYAYTDPITPAHLETIMNGTRNAVTSGATIVKRAEGGALQINIYRDALATAQAGLAAVEAAALLVPAGMLDAALTANRENVAYAERCLATALRVAR